MRMGAPQQGQTKVGAAGRCAHGAAPFKDEADCLAFNVGSHQPLPTGNASVTHRRSSPRPTARAVSSIGRLAPILLPTGTASVPRWRGSLRTEAQRQSEPRRQLPGRLVHSRKMRAVQVAQIVVSRRGMMSAIASDLLS